MIRMTGLKKHIHFVGIGGIGMSAIAEYLHRAGYRVSGSDRERSSVTQRLRRIGVGVQHDHVPRFVKQADVVVYSSAIRQDNPERRWAVRHGRNLMRRAEILGEIMRSQFTIGVAGTHGKTTTTSLLGHLFRHAGKKPTVLVGGILRDKGSNAVIGDGKLLIAEADEYDRSFLKMFPAVAVITNVEADHLDCYGSLDEIKDAFVTYANLVPFYGAVVACLDDAGVKDILPRIRRTVVTYGVSARADYRAKNVSFRNRQTRFAAFHKSKPLGSVSLPLHGIHNVKNALAAIAVAGEMGIGFAVMRRALAGFSGVKRRFEVVGIKKGITVIDDYAHHPSEIAATLDGARAAGFKRIIAIFQPHLYSRTRDFLSQFAVSLAAADIAVVTGIYQSREEPIPGVRSEAIVTRMSRRGAPDAHYVERKEDVSNLLMPIVKHGDAVLFMGAGDIWKIANEFTERLRHA